MKCSVATAAVLAVLLAGCGSGSGTPAAQPVATTGPTLPSIDAPAGTAAPPPALPASTGASVLPDIEVDDVAAGTKVDLTSLAPSAQPLLLWLWAPH